SDDPPALHFYNISNGSISSQGHKPVAQRARNVLPRAHWLTGNFDYVLPSRDGLSISLIQLGDAGMREWALRSSGGGRGLAVADLNNDRIADILLFGKSALGVTVLLGNTDGTFRRTRALFPDISVSDIVTADLNEDGITDVFLVDWLSNRLMIFYGIGQDVFSEQVMINLPGEPAQLAVSPVSQRRTIAVAVTIPERQMIAVVKGDASGDFSLKQRIACDGEPGGVTFSDINGDTFPDLVSSTSRGIMVMLAGQHGFLSDPVTFGVCSSPSSWLLTDLDGTGTPHIVVADKGGKRLIAIANVRSPSADSWSNRYAVGSNPRGLATRDFDGDGNVDIVVANTNSSTLSLLFNKGNGRMSGQQSLPVTEQPVFIRAAVSALPSVRTVVASHSGHDRLTVVRLAEDVSRSLSYTIPTASNPYVLHAKEQAHTGRLEMSVRYTRKGGKSVSLFEQLGPAQFLERSLRFSPNTPVGTVTVGDFTEKGRYDLLYSSYNGKARRTSVSIAFAEPGFSFRSMKELFSYGDSSNATRMMLSGWVDRDAEKDIIVVLGSPKNALGIVYGKGNGAFEDSIRWHFGIRPVNEDAVIVDDVDGDGHPDIVVVDELRKGVVVLYGWDGRVFDEPILVHAGDDIGGMRIASLADPGKRDLVVTHFRSGTVEILYQPFQR
ncbi:MAG: VCBS repeat-containing protein, partial [Ignavibacteria bacterium]|nr:VCBS repeat-containing protein [Ignavibacteria bacterium]